MTPHSRLMVFRTLFALAFAVVFFGEIMWEDWTEANRNSIESVLTGLIALPVVMYLLYQLAKRSRSPHTVKEGSSEMLPHSRLILFRIETVLAVVAVLIGKNLWGDWIATHGYPIGAILLEGLALMVAIYWVYLLAKRTKGPRSV